MLQELVAEANPWWRDRGARLGRRFPRRRHAFDELWRRLEDSETPRGVVLLGPRQSGKTVLIHQLVDALLDAGTPPARILRFDFSDDRLSSPAPSPRDVLACAPPVKQGKRVFALLDEVQRVPNWDRWLKHAVDEGNIKALATGSSALRLREGAIESGTGRWDEVRIGGLTYSEFLQFSAVEGESREDYLERDPAALERYLALGGSPAHFLETPGLDLRRRIREDIVDRSILKDLLPTGIDVAKVKDLFVYLAGCSGAQFRAAKRAPDLGSDQRSLRNYLRLLEDAGLVSALNEYPLRTSGGKRTARSQLRYRPKIYAADHGPISAFSYQADPTSDPDTRSRIFEATVFRHLRWAANRLGTEVPSFYRNRDGLEIDFVLALGEGNVGVEVTSKPGGPGKIKRLSEVANRLSLVRTVLVGASPSGGNEDIRAIDLQRFLLDPVQYLQGHGEE